MGVPVSFSENYVTSLALKGLALDDADDEVAELVVIVLQLVLRRSMVCRSPKLGPRPKA